MKLFILTCLLYTNIMSSVNNIEKILTKLFNYLKETFLKFCECYHFGSFKNMI